MKNRLLISLVGLIIVNNIFSADAYRISDALMKKRDTKYIESLITPYNFNKIDISGESPLHWAVIMNRPEIVQLLLDKGANINIRGESNITPLTRAVINGENNIADILVKKGADKTLKDKYGRTALDIAEKGKKEALIKILKGPSEKELKEHQEEVKPIIKESGTELQIP